jgi:regulator of protease activity HflC (stomatin/prohibitin superfamily)
MQGWFVFAIILWVAAAIAAAVGVFLPVRTIDGAPARLTAMTIAAGVAFFGAISAVIACYDRVDTRNVGIVTQFGRPTGVRGAGIAWHAPWQKISELSEAIQLQAFDGNSYDDHGQMIQVRLGNNSSAYVAENLNWRLREGAAPQLFQDYGGSASDVFAVIKENLVDRQAAVALSKVFSSFDPTTQAQGADLPKMALQVRHDLQEAVGQEIEILDVRIPKIAYDKATQERIDQHNQKVQETKNAEQDVSTAQQRKSANDIIGQSVSGDPLVVVAQCIDSQVHNGKDPAGCWPIGGSPLINLPQPGR